jgi:hypothetical protein
MKKKILLEKVAAAKRDIMEAENHLERVLQEVQTAPRADKAIISKVVEDAFSKLKTVRTNLLEVESLVKGDDT